MDRLLFIILVSALADAYVPKFRIFEIRNTKDLPSFPRVDEMYFDPDSMGYQFGTKREKDNKKHNINLDSILKRLERFSDSKASNERQSDDSSTSESSGFVDETRSLLVIPKDHFLYHNNPKKDVIIKKFIQSALRSKFEDVEDRTAPPRHHIPYEYDY